MLLDAGADIEARDERGTTPLFLALAYNNPAVLTALLNAGMDPNARSRGGSTPLHMAAAAVKNPAVITVLLDAGADPKARDKVGKTPWDHAEDNEALKGSAAYWRLNDARF